MFIGDGSPVVWSYPVLSLDLLVEQVETFFVWLNANQGILTLTIFIATVTLGWGSGIFSALRRRPKLKVKLIDGPTFSCTFRTGAKHGDFDMHRTGVALYLHITNSGSAPTSIVDIELGYHWHLRPISINWLKHRLGWFWLLKQSVVLADFQVAIGDNTKVFPFLTQINHLSAAVPKTYLRIGESTNGVVYFEQDDSWGGCFPRAPHGFTKIKLRLRDAHGRHYDSMHKIQVVDFVEAQKYNLRFGETYKELRGEILPVHENQIMIETDQKANDDADAT